MPKKKVTSSLHPLPFEHLEPKRFEDLARNLVYDFRDWQTIEDTGRLGSDEGYDARAWEKQGLTEQDEEERDPMDGNLWQFQFKREKQIGPSRMGKIIDESIRNKKEAPYGYLLIANCDFSKKTRDVFRNKLRKLGILEFELWGRAILEDKLYMPKNDHLLFAYFGISLVARRRSNTTRVRAKITTKNKLLKLLGGGILYRVEVPILVREANDEHYPFHDEYPDFKDYPRWREYFATRLSFLGLIVTVKKLYAYISDNRKEWDFAKGVDTLNRRFDKWDEEILGKDYEETKGRVFDYWDFLPQKNKAEFVVKGVIPYEGIIAIDNRGDNLNQPYEHFPHVFAEYKKPGGPFKGFFGYLEFQGQTLNVKELKQKSFFPKTFPKVKAKRLIKNKMMGFAPKIVTIVQSGMMTSTFRLGKKYDFLKVRNRIGVKDSSTGEQFGTIVIKEKYWITFGKLSHREPGHEGYASKKDMKENFEKYYDKKITNKEKFLVLRFGFSYN